MSGIFGQRKTRRALSGIGALGATVPSNCWDVTGFKECNADGWKVAERKCITEGLANKEFGGDWEKCKAQVASDYAYYGCAMRLCPPPIQPAPKKCGDWTWKNTTPVASVLTFQQHLNVALARAGYKPITADGKLGPATCGAFNFVGGKYPELFATDPVANVACCQAFTNPTLLGQSTPVKSPQDADGKKLDELYGGLPWLMRDGRAPNLQQELNRQLDSLDYEPINVTGMLDAPMCGAMLAVDAETGSRWFDTWGPIQMASCPAVVKPKRRVTPPSQAEPLPAGPASPVLPTEPPSTSSSATSSVGLLAAGLLTALGIGAYAWYKKSGA